MCSLCPAGFGADLWGLCLWSTPFQLSWRWFDTIWSHSLVSASWACFVMLPQRAPLLGPPCSCAIVFGLCKTAWSCLILRLLTPGFVDFWFSYNYFPEFAGLYSRRLTWSSLQCVGSSIDLDGSWNVAYWCYWMAGHYCPSLRPGICFVFTQGFLRNLAAQFVTWWSLSLSYPENCDSIHNHYNVTTVVWFDPWLSMLISRAFWACWPPEVHFFRVYFMWSSWGVKRQRISND